MAPGCRLSARAPLPAVVINPFTLFHLGDCRKLHSERATCVTLRLLLFQHVHQLSAASTCIVNEDIPRLFAVLYYTFGWCAPPENLALILLPFLPRSLFMLTSPGTSTATSLTLFESAPALSRSRCVVYAAQLGF